MWNLVTKPKQMKEALWESEELFRSAFWQILKHPDDLNTELIATKLW